jgi:hypothetical protein
VLTVLRTHHLTNAVHVTAARVRMLPNLKGAVGRQPEAASVGLLILYQREMLTRLARRTSILGGNCCVSSY